jgi:hypothetical protein
MRLHRALPGLVALICLHGIAAHAGGLRSLVALPLEPGGIVTRLQVVGSSSPDNMSVTGTVLYGLTTRQTLIISVPYRDLESGEDGLGYVTGLYRHTIFQHDAPGATRRIAVIGGVRVPTDSNLDPQIGAGLVATTYKRRSEWDFDVLWMEALGRSGNSARYDISWQYRLSPSEYPEWGIPTEWQSVVELGGRYSEGSEMVHQLTFGALWVHPSWVFEAGIIQDLNGPDATSFLLGIRTHF